MNKFKKTVAWLLATFLISLASVPFTFSAFEEGGFWKLTGNTLEPADSSWTVNTGGGTGLEHVEDDTSPALGGDLDLNGFGIDAPTTQNIDDIIDDDTMATASDTNLATSESIKAYVDDALADNKGPKTVNLMVKDDSESCATGDGAGDVFYNFPSNVDGDAYNLVGVVATSQTAGTTGTMTIQVRNVTQGADMLSTRVTVDSTEKTSLTAATPPVIDANNDDLNKGDEIRVDIDGCHSTPSLGVELILYFEPA